MHRRDHFRAEKILQDRLFKNPKIAVVWDSVLDDVHRRRRRRSRSPSVRLKNVKTGAVTERPVDGVFIAIGHTPASELFAGPARDEARRLHQDRPALDRDHRCPACSPPAT